MDDPDLQLLRGFRADEAEPPDGLQARIEERLWQEILAEESAAAGRRGPSGLRRWYDGLLRPAVAAGAAASVAIGVAVAGGGGETGTVSNATQPLTQAGVLDSTATSLFGDSAATGSSTAPIEGAIDLTNPDERLTRGPQVDEDGELDDATRELVSETSRDPAALQAKLRQSASALAGSDPTDRVAFNLAMSWVTAKQVPTDLRAAMLRSLEGMAGVDAAIMGVDLLGRQGVVLGHHDPTTGLRSQFLLHLEGGQLLEQRTFTTGYVDPACPPGTFTSHALYDEQGAPVTSTDAPWLDWPQVVSACDPMAA